MKRIPTILISVFLLAACWWLLNKLDVVPSLKNIFKPKEVTIQNTPVLVREIKSIAQLVTISAYDEIVADSTAVVKTNVPATLLLPPIPLPVFNTDKKLVIVGRVTTHIGLNMEKLTVDDVTVTKDSIHIWLPPAEVLDVILNPSDVDIFIEQGSWDNTAITNLKNKIRYIAEANVKSKGLFIQSEKKAEDLFTNFFKAAGFQKVTIDFKV